MNNFLSFNRLEHLIKIYWRQRMKSILLLFLAVAASLSLWYGINIILQVRHIFNIHNQILFYFIGLFLTGCLTGSILFSDLKEKPRAISYLLLPVSAFEKIICTFLFGVVGLFVIYSTAYIVIDLFFVTLANHVLQMTMPVLNLFAINTYEPEMGDEKNTLYLMIYFAVQSSFIFGSIYFKNNALLKTIVTIVLVWSVFVIGMWCLRHSIPPGMGREDHLIYEVFDTAGDNKLITLPPIIHLLDNLFLKFGITIGLWTASYFRLKEKQII